MKPRLLSNKEMADLPDTGWHNFTEDSSKYYVSFLQAWEVDRPLYESCKLEGNLCIIHEGKYYIAR